MSLVSMLKILHIPKSLFSTSNYKVLLFFYKLWVSVRCLFCYNLEINGIIPCEQLLLLMPLFSRDLFPKEGYKKREKREKKYWQSENRSNQKEPDILQKLFGSTKINVSKNIILPAFCSATLCTSTSPKKTTMFN